MIDAIAPKAFGNVLWRSIESTIRIAPEVPIIRAALSLVAHPEPMLFAGAVGDGQEPFGICEPRPAFGEFGTKFECCRGRWRPVLDGYPLALGNEAAFDPRRFREC